MELEQYWQFGAALVFVLALIGVLFWVIQKVGFGGGKGRRGSRLGIVEAAVVDKRRRLVLIRRDAVEHLVMIGGPQDVVVENNITRTSPTLATDTIERKRDNGPDFNIRPGEQVALAAAPLASTAMASEPPLADDDVAPAVPQSAALPDVDTPLPQEPAAAPASKAEPAIIPARPQEPPREPAIARPEPVTPVPAANVHPKPDAAPARPQEPLGASELTRSEEPSKPEEPHKPEDPNKSEDLQRADESLRPEEPRRPMEPTRPAAPARPWPPSEGRFREAQRRFAERSDYHPPGRGAHEQSAAELSTHYPPERQIANRAAPDGMPPPDRSREVSQESPPRTPANLNVRPGED